LIAVTERGAGGNAVVSATSQAATSVANGLFSGNAALKQR
jgi:hypothetical protein